jgi:hypothetical protein
MRDPGVIDALDALERYARAFDQISDEQDARYSARSFVRWLRLETTAPRGQQRRIDAPNEVGLAR